MRNGDPVPATAGTLAGQAGVLPRLLAFARRPGMRGVVGVALLKVPVIALNFAVIALAARVLGSHDFGTYSILFSAVGLVSIMATFGQQMLVMRFWGEYAGAGDAGRLKGALLYSAAICGFGAALSGLGLFGWQMLAGGGPTLGSAVGVYAASMTIVMTTAHLVRVAVGVGRGDGLPNILSAALPVALLATCLALGTSPGLAPVFAASAAGLIVSLAIHAVLMRRLLRAIPGFAAARPVQDRTAWNPRSLKLWLGSAIEVSNQYLDVLLIGFLMSPAAAGAYFVTTRLANAFATASDAFNMFSTRHIPDLFYRGEHKALSDLLDSVSVLTAVMIGCGLVGLLGAGPWLLSVFNPDYAAYYPALAVLTLGTAAIAGIGSSPSVLMLTGHEGRYLSILAVSIMVRAGGFLLLVPAYGVLGAAVATTASFLLMAVLIGRAASRHSGFDCSVLRLLRHRH